jgi:periplasmic divalent cation tolerance protein
MSGYKLVLTTTGSREEAQRIARALVERRLAACVNIVPGIESIYRWKEKIEQADEWLLPVKTTSSTFERVRDAIKELHSYDVPEYICIEIEDGSAEYLEWISESVVPSRPSP